VTDFTVQRQSPFLPVKIYVILRRMAEKFYLLEELCKKSSRNKKMVKK